MCVSLFFNKVAGCEPATLLNKKLQYRCFPVNFEKLLKKYFLLNISWRASLTLTEQNTFCLKYKIPTFQKCWLYLRKKISIPELFQKINVLKTWAKLPVAIKPKNYKDGRSEHLTNVLYEPSFGCIINGSLKNCYWSG